MQGGSVNPLDTAAEYLRQTAELQQNEAARVAAADAERKASLDSRMRDHFAGIALEGLLNGRGFGAAAMLQDWAYDAYNIAEAMLTERKKRGASDEGL